MRTPRDVFIYAERLRTVRELQDNRSSSRPDTALPALSSEHRQEVELFKAGKLNQRHLSKDTILWLSIESMNAQRNDPFFYSDLPVLLEQETWAPMDAILILAGIDPSAAIVEWSYDNFMGAKVNSPKIRHANWFASVSELYDYPVPEDFEYTSHELKGLISEAEKSGNEQDLKKLAHRLAELEKWENDEVSKFKRAVLGLRSSMVEKLKRRWESCDHDVAQRRSPAFFVRWAETRGFEIEWAAWAREHRYLDYEAPASSAPFFDADAEDYPRLLHIAVRAWEHARQSAGGTAKQRIAAYLIDRYPELSGSERDAISMIGNWQKAGGRPKTGG